MLEAKCHQLGTPPLVAGGGLHGIGVAHHFARTVQNQKSAISLTPTWTIVARVVASHDVVSRWGHPPQQQHTPLHVRITSDVQFVTAPAPFVSLAAAKQKQGDVR